MDRAREGRSRRTRGVGVLVGVLLATGCAGDADPGDGTQAPGTGPGDAFLANLAVACGQAFAGGLVIEPEGDPMLTGTEALLVHFRDCEPDEVRIPFHVELESEGAWDRSRTWVVTRHPDHLELRHDHREPDGSESARTWYGGRSEGSGTAVRQDFHSPERTEVAGVPVGWRIEIEPGVAFRYGTTHDGEYDWMIEFDLSRPLPGEVPDAWGHDLAPSRVPGPP